MVALLTHALALLSFVCLRDVRRLKLRPSRTRPAAFERARAGHTEHARTRSAHRYTSQTRQHARDRKNIPQWKSKIASQSPSAATADAVRPPSVLPIHTPTNPSTGKSSITLRLVRSEWTSEYASPHPQAIPHTPLTPPATTPQSKTPTPSHAPSTATRTT